MTRVLRAHVLVGATGCGKSALAMRWAADTGNSIISCDSMQVYCGLNIGTAKPSPADQQRVRHALIDVVNLPTVYSAAQWAAVAAVCIREENQAGRTPLICGGTGFYLRALLEGLSGIPEVPEAIRQELNERLHREGNTALHSELQQVDGEAARRIPAADSQRLLRALGVYRASGRPLSDWQQGSQASLLQGRICCLQKPRQQLRQDIAERFHAMMAAGWLDEVRWLQSLALSDEHPAMRAVGYRQLLAYLRGECSLDEAITAGITATRRYAKRQETWFRHQLHSDFQGSARELEKHLWTTP